MLRELGTTSPRETWFLIDYSEEKSTSMAKKRTQPRRVPRTSEPRMYGDGKPSQAAQAAGKPGVPVSATPAARPAAAPRVPVTVTQDYHYVMNDLRRLGIVAAATFAALVALGLIIR